MTIVLSYNKLKIFTDSLYKRNIKIVSNNSANKNFILKNITDNFILVVLYFSTKFCRTIIKYNNHLFIKQLS